MFTYLFTHLLVCYVRLSGRGVNFRTVMLHAHAYDLPPSSSNNYLQFFVKYFCQLVNDGDLTTTITILLAAV